MSQPRATKTSSVTPTMIAAGIHEPLSFRRRTGNARTNEPEFWEREHSEELVRALAARGITWVRTHFYKGNGLAVEAAEIALTRDFVKRCHKHGIKVQLYAQFGTLQYETLLAEAPDMLDWICINEDGQPVRIRYGHQDFRYKPCFVRDGFWAYFKAVLTCGIEDVGGDGFGFDNVEGPSEPDACHCPACRAAFVAFLKGRYPTDTEAGRKRAEERFGFAILDHIRPPVFNRFNPPVTCREIKNPVLQEWMEFRCENMRRRMAEIWKHIKSRRADMLIEYNVYPPYGKNGPFWQGIDMHRLGPYLDMFYNERDPDFPVYTPDGQFAHRVHGYKLAHAIGAEGAITGTGGATPAQRNLALAEALVFNQGHIARIGRTLDVADGELPEADAFIAFRQTRADLFERTTAAADVALVESVPSRALNSVEPYVAGILAMNGLLAGHVPFDLIADPGSDDVRRYRMLVLPDVECMTDETADLLMDYVAEGGAVVLTGAVACYDAWRRRRPESGLAQMLKVADGYAPLDNLPAETLLKGTYGKGRFVYLRRLVSAVDTNGFEHCTDGPNIRPEVWRLAENHAALLEAVSWAGAGRLRVLVSGSTGLAVEMRTTEDRRLLVHLVNFCLAEAASSVRVDVPDGTFREARLWSPWQAEAEALPLAAENGAQRVVPGTIERYAVLELLP